VIGSPPPAGGAGTHHDAVNGNINDAVNSNDTVNGSHRPKGADISTLLKTGHFYFALTLYC